MKIGILTLPLHTNYGGILQAWALQTVLEREGHEVTHIEERRKPIKLPLYKVIPVYTKRIFNFVRNGFKGRVRLEKYQNESYPIVGQYTHIFISKYINVRRIDSFSDLNNNDFECLVVGSDQIWKPSYFKNISHAFLDFAENWHVKRVAYAPSLGSNNWCFTAEQTTKSKQLIEKFDIVSVREKSSISLVKDNLGVIPQWVLDPTLLLQKEDYLVLIKETPKSAGDLLVYLLDITKEKKEFVERIAKERNLTPFYVSANPENFYLDIEDRIQPPLEKWLKGFDDAKLVITDSFHACVFSVIFKISFIVLGNAKRGQARFYSLFDVLGFNGSILTDLSKFSNQDINRINDYKQLNKSREAALALLRSI